MSLSLNTAFAARASVDDWCGTKPHPLPHPHTGGSGDDGDWCGTKPGPHPHFGELSSLGSRLEQVALNPQPLPPGGDGQLGHGGSVAFDPDNPCGNGIIKGPFPPRPHLSDALGAVSHQVMNAVRGM